MIDILELNTLLENYNLNYSDNIKELICKNNTYEQLKSVLDYLINDLSIEPSVIKKYPILLWANINTIKTNYNFLSDKRVSNTEDFLFVLGIESKKLEDTYNYVLNNYGKDIIDNNPLILGVSKEEIEEYEKVLDNVLSKEQIIIACTSKNSIEDILKIVDICTKKKINMTEEVFHSNPDNLRIIVGKLRRNNYPFFYESLKRTPEEIEEIIKILKDNEIAPTREVFLKEVEEIKKVIDICKKYNLKINSSFFKTNSFELERIIDYCHTNNIVFSTVMLNRSYEEIISIKNICDSNNVVVLETMFNRAPEEINEIIKVCSSKNITITSSVFVKEPEKIEEIISVCEKLNLPITGIVFKRNPQEIREIVSICKELLGEVYPTCFYRTPEDVKKIITLCNDNNIPITGVIFKKAYDELEESINYLKEEYGKEYLLPQIIIHNKNHIEAIFGYLQGRKCLHYLKDNIGILSLSIEEIVERDSFINNIGESFIVEDGINPIFGLSKKRYMDEKERLLSNTMNR